MDLVVNISKGQSVVPDLKGLTLSDARERLSSMGLMVGSVTTKEDSAPKGTVIGAEPEFGKVLSEGSVVTLIVSGGKKKKRNRRKLVGLLPKPQRPIPFPLRFLAAAVPNR